MYDPSALSGKWLVCRWHFPARQGHPHPQDAHLILKAWTGVAKCVGHEGEYLLLELGSGTVRVVPFSVLSLPGPPAFAPGQPVRVRPGTLHSPFESRVTGIEWHFKNDAYMYCLDGKGTRYWEADLEEA